MLQTRFGRRATAATALGVMCALVLVAVQVAGVLPRGVVAVAGPAALLAVPVSREFSRRVAIVLLIALGWAPLAWLSPWPTGQLTRAGGVTAVLVGVLVGWVALGPVRERLARLVPRFRRIDAVAVGGVTVVLGYLWPLLRLRSPVDTMAVVLNGWDHVGHYDMTRMIVHEGRLIPLIPVGDAGPYFYDSYPQGLHSTLAMLVELREGVGWGSGIGEVAAYLQAPTIAYAATLTAVICCLCALPAVRRRPGRAALSVAALVVAWTVSPGGGILHAAGFDNFLLATAGVACLPMLVAMTPRIRFSPVTLAAGGALLAVAHNWLLLVPMAAMATLMVAWPMRRTRFPSGRAGRLALAAVAVVTGVGVLLAGVQVLSARGAGHLLTAGGFPTHNLAGYLVPIALALLAALFLRGRAGWTLGGAVLFVGLGLFAWVASTQVIATGQVGYYGIKLLAAILLVALTMLAAIVAIHGTHRVTMALLAVSLVVTSVLPLVRQLGDFPSVRVRQAWAAPAAAAAVDETATLERMLALPLGDREAFFLPGPTQDSGTIAHLNLWQMAIRGAWTQRADTCWQGAWKQDGADGGGWSDRRDAEASVRAMSACGDSVAIVAPQAQVDGLRVRMPDLAPRVLGWTASG